MGQFGGCIVVYRRTTLLTTQKKFQNIIPPTMSSLFNSGGILPQKNIRRMAFSGLGCFVLFILLNLCSVQLRRKNLLLQTWGSRPKYSCAGVIATFLSSHETFLADNRGRAGGARTTCVFVTLTLTPFNNQPLSPGWTPHPPASQPEAGKPATSPQPPRIPLPPLMLILIQAEFQKKRAWKNTTRMKQKRNRK